jgi:hypothetical protein
MLRLPRKVNRDVLIDTHALHICAAVDKNGAPYILESI